MSRIFHGSFALALALASNFAVAQSFSVDANPPSGASDPIVRGSCGPTTLTQSTSQIPVVGSVSCNGGASVFAHADNRYFRAYSLAAFPTGFSACGVEVGIETANAAGVGTTQPITVNLYASTGGAFPAGTLAQVGTATVDVADQTLSLLNVPLTGTVPAGAELVVELFTPDGQVAGHSFFIGSNAAGQSGTGYIQAAACGIATPTALAGIGFPNMHIVLNVVGDVAGSGELTITPSAVDFGGQGVGSTSAAQTVTLANIGSGSLDIGTLTAPSGAFARSGGTCAANTPITIAAGANCTVDYTFTPAAAGVVNQVLTVTVTGPATGSGTITLEGTGAAGTLSYSSSTVTFGGQTVGGSSVRTLTLSNTGGASLQISALDAPTAPFARTGGTCSTVPITIAAGANCTIIYTFAPTAAGNFSQILAVTSDANGGGPITLTGAGVVAIPLPAGSTLSALLLLLSLVGVAGVVLTRRN
jgi:hypothetical protein